MGSGGGGEGNLVEGRVITCMPVMEVGGGPSGRVDR